MKLFNFYFMKVLENLNEDFSNYEKKLKKNESLIVDNESKNIDNKLNINSEPFKNKLTYNEINISNENKNNNKFLELCSSFYKQNKYEIIIIIINFFLFPICLLEIILREINNYNFYIQPIVGCVLYIIILSCLIYKIINHNESNNKLSKIINILYIGGFIILMIFNLTDICVYFISHNNNEFFLAKMRILFTIVILIFDILIILFLIILKRAVNAICKGAAAAFGPE